MKETRHEARLLGKNKIIYKPVEAFRINGVPRNIAKYYSVKGKSVRPVEKT